MAPARRAAHVDQESLGLDTDNWLRAYRKSVRSHPSIESALAYFKRIFDDAPAPFIITNTDLVIADANKAALKMLRRSLVTLREKPLFMIVAREDRIALRTIATDILSEEHGITRPLRIQPLRDAKIDLVVSACACRDENGVPECVFWIFMHSLESGNGNLL